MNIPDFKWKNQYMDKMPLHREHIFGFALGALDPSEIARFKAMCANWQAFVIEFGSGSGGHIIAQAERAPETLFVGFELRFKRTVRTVEKSKQLGRSNVVLINADARLVPEFFAARSLNGAYMNFPDPWTKAHWRKHRMLSAALLDQLSELLVPGGFFSFKSDSTELFDEALELFLKHPAFELAAQINNTLVNPIAGNVETEFENMFTSKRIPIGFFEARRRP